LEEGKVKGKKASTYNFRTPKTYSSPGSISSKRGKKGEGETFKRGFMGVTTYSSQKARLCFQSGRNPRRKKRRG